MSSDFVQQQVPEIWFCLGHLGLGAFAPLCPSYSFYFINKLILELKIVR